MGKLNKLLAAALDMSHSARMARARELGFDTDRVWYHGTNQDFDAFDPRKINSVESSGDYLGEGFYFTPDPAKASRYAEQAVRSGGGDQAVVASHLRMENPLVIEREGDFDEVLKAIEVPGDVRDLGGLTDQEMRMVAFYDMEPSQQAAFIRAQGYDGLMDKRYGQAAVFDPNQIRRTDAAFDPAKKDSSNLLASLAGAGVLAGAMLPSEEAEAGVISQALKAKYPDVQFWLTEKGDRATLDKVVVPEELRNSGLGTQFMQDLTEMASKEGKTLALTASADFGGNKKRLEEFYRRFGFVPNKGRAKDYEISEGMYRLPVVGGAGLLGAAALSPEDATAAELVHSTGPGPDLALLRAAYGEGEQQPNLLTSLFNSGTEMAAAVNRGVTSGVDFLTVDQANALLQLLGAEQQLPTLTETLAPATQGNFLQPGTHRDATRALGELLSPI